MISEKEIADALNDGEDLKGNCPNCSTLFSVPARWSGREAKCKKCHKKFLVPYRQIQASPPSVTSSSSSRARTARPAQDSILLPGVVAEKRKTNTTNELMWGQKLNIAVAIFLVLNLAAAIAASFEAIELESLAWISSTLWVMFVVYACASFGRAVTGYLQRIAENQGSSR